MNDRSTPTAWISRSALLHNARLIRRALSPGTRLCAVVKANAYGHDAGIVADTLANFQTGDESDRAVDAFAVASMDEAEALAGVRLPVMILRPVENVYLGQQRERFEMAIRSGWTLTLNSSPAAGDIARLAEALGMRANVQVMVDSGMARCGVPVDQLDGLLDRVSSFPSLRLTSLCSHFSEADVPASRLVSLQLGQFLKATDDHAHRQARLSRHIANSGGIFFGLETHLDMVRAGLAMYGIDPRFKPSQDRPLRPVMKWTAPLLTLRDLPAGSPVGYNQTWLAPRDTRLGLVPVGYADGYLRAFSNRAVMLVGGLAAPVVGRVSMDLVTIDLTDHPQASVGDQVTILDSDPLSPCSVYALARLGDTIPYEIFCHIGRRIRRVAIDPADEPETSAETGMAEKTTF